MFDVVLGLWKLCVVVLFVVLGYYLINIVKFLFDIRENIDDVNCICGLFWCYCVGCGWFV